MGKIAKEIVGVVLFLSIGMPLYGAVESSMVKTCLERFDRYFRDIASTPTFAGESIDSVNALFQKIQKKYSMISVLLRTNSSGEVINSIIADANTKSVQSIANQKWFSSVKDSLHPYFGTARDPSGTMYLFWAWPLQTGKGAQARFAGALTAKIDAAKLFKDRIDSTGAPIQILVKGKAVFSRSWKKDVSFSEDSIGSFGQSAVSVRYTSTAITQNNTRNSAVVKEETADSQVSEPKVFSTTEKKTEMTVQEASVAPKKSENDSIASEATPQTAAVASPVIKIVQVAVALVVAALLLTIILLYMRKQKRTNPYATIENKKEQTPRQSRPGETSRLYARVPSLNEKKDDPLPGQLSSLKNPPSPTEDEFVIDSQDDGIVKGSIKPIVSSGEQKKPKAIIPDEKAEPVLPPSASSMIVAQPTRPATVQSAVTLSIDETVTVHSTRPSQNEKATVAQSKASVSSQLKSYELMENEIRSKLYREIHGQITHWVIGELDQIKTKLNVLTEQLHLHEQHDNVSSEFERETRDLTSDIENFERALINKKEE